MRMDGARLGTRRRVMQKAMGGQDRRRPYLLWGIFNLVVF